MKTSIRLAGALALALGGGAWASAAELASQAPVDGFAVSRWSKLWQDPDNDLDGDAVTWQDFQLSAPASIDRLEWWGYWDPGANPLGFTVEVWRQDPSYFGYRPEGWDAYVGDSDKQPVASLQLPPGRVSVELAPGGHETWQGPVTLMHYTVELSRPIELAANDAANPRWFIDIVGLTDTPWAEWNWWQGSGPSHNSFQFIRGDGYTFWTLPEARAIRLTSAVPEPAASALLLSGLLGLGWRVRQRAGRG